MCNDCKDYKKIIDELCYDDAFGILTRNGLNHRVNNLNDISNLHIILMDFCNVSKLNQHYGYESVNKKFTKLFSNYNDKNLIGRCFSGDEIIVITNNISIVNDFKKRGAGLNLFFKHCSRNFSGNIKKDLIEMYHNIYLV